MVGLLQVNEDQEEQRMQNATFKSKPHIVIIPATICFTRFRKKQYRNLR